MHRLRCSCGTLPGREVIYVHAEYEGRLLRMSSYACPAFRFVIIRRRSSLVAQSSAVWGADSWCLLSPGDTIGGLSTQV